MTNIFREQNTKRLRTSDLFLRSCGGNSHLIAGEFWESAAANGGAKISIATLVGAGMVWGRRT